MLHFILRRIAGAIPTIFIIITLTFFMIRLVPGGPFDLERQIDPLILANLQKAYHLDLPLWQQYLIYLKNLIQGDLGPSFSRRDFTVNQLIMTGLPVSALLGSLSLLLASGLGIILGTIAALRQNSAFDYYFIGFATFGITTPNLVVAPLLSLLFGVTLGWLPAGGWSQNNIYTWILPVIALALPQIGVIARLIRSATIEALHSDHIRTARAYGLPSRIIVGVHALRAAILPVISYLGPAAAALLTGSVIIESVFGIPGIGRYFVKAALSRDYTLVMGVVILVSVFVVLFSLLVDIAYVIIDPRVRYE